MTTNSINNTSSSLTTTDIFTTNLSFDGGITNISEYTKNTFTPILQFGGNSTGIIYSTQIGTFVVIGNICSVYITIGLINKGTATGVATISGYTHPSTNFLIRQPITTIDIIVGGMGPILQLVGSQPYELYFQESNNLITALDNTDFTDISQIWINTSFQIN